MNSKTILLSLLLASAGTSTHAMDVRAAVIEDQQPASEHIQRLRTQLQLLATQRRTLDAQGGGTQVQRAALATHYDALATLMTRFTGLVDDGQKVVRQCRIKARGLRLAPLVPRGRNLFADE